MKSIMRRKNGQSFVEFALILPLLALLLFGIIQYGFIFSAYMTLRHAANVAARTASLSPANTVTSNVTAVVNQAISPMLDPAKVTGVVVNDVGVGTGATTNAISVQITYNLPLIIQFVVPGSTGNTLVMKSQAIYRKGG